MLQASPSEKSTSRPAYPPGPYPRPHGGFTLIELLVAVAIVGILAAIAYPSYRDQILKTRRADAKAVLMQAAQFMERIHSETGCYDPGDDYDCVSGDPAAVIPFDKSPIDGDDTHFEIGIVASSLGANTYTLYAAPTASVADAGCLQIDDTGTRYWDADASVSDANCKGQSDRGTPELFADEEEHW